MRVQVQDRVNDDTIICKVSWDRPSSTTTARFVVRIPATLAEFS